MRDGAVLSTFPVAVGVAEVPLAEVAGLRRTVGVPGGPPLAPSFLKAAEDQTVVALVALARAARVLGQSSEAYREWGVVAAPRSLGRLGAAEAIHKYEQGGAWKVSPLIVPHRSPHSVSGTISLAYRIEGPNFGVGSHAGAVVEGFLATLTLLDEGRLPGVWLVLSEADPEPVPDDAGACVVPVVYRALALGFGASAAGLHLVWGEPSAATAPAPTVAELIAFLGADGQGPRRWSYTLGWGARLELERPPAGGLRRVA
jgi:hypothetical protein